MLSKGALLLFMALVSAGLDAAEFMTLQMHAFQRYRDADGYCESMRHDGEFILSAEIAGGKPTKVIISNFPYIWPYTYIYRSLRLLPSALELTQDQEGRYWVKRLALIEPQLAWLIFWPSERFSSCRVPQGIVSSAPAPILFVFDTEDIDDGIHMSYSQRVDLAGHRNDGLKYETKLRLMQTLYRRGGIFPFP